MYYSNVPWVLHRPEAQETRRFVQPFVQTNNAETGKDLHYFHVWGEPPMTGGFPTKGQVMWKKIPGDDAIMFPTYQIMTIWPDKTRVYYALRVQSKFILQHNGLRVRGKSLGHLRRSRCLLSEYTGTPCTNMD